MTNLEKCIERFDALYNFETTSADFQDQEFLKFNILSPWYGKRVPGLVFSATEHTLLSWQLRKIYDRASSSGKRDFFVPSRVRILRKIPFLFGKG